MLQTHTSPSCASLPCRSPSVPHCRAYQLSKVPCLHLQRQCRDTQSVASSPSIESSGQNLQRRRLAELVLPSHATTHTAASFSLRLPLPTSTMNSLPQSAEDTCSLRQTLISRCLPQTSRAAALPMTAEQSPPL
jgi:hypothetical protein